MSGKKIFMSRSDGRLETIDVYSSLYMFHVTIYARLFGVQITKLCLLQDK